MLVNLISPRSPTEGTTSREKAVLFSRLTLATVAATFPEDVEIRIINDSMDMIDFDEKVDMVGITAMTSTVPRAYEIADKFREKGVTVVLGGIHPTALPEEASLHADAVVIGEAEGTMHHLTNDFKTGKLKKFYRSTNRPDLKNLTLPRKDLLSGNKYYGEWDMIQTTRGCPFDCNFCSVSEFFGQTYRTRPIPDVIKEIKQLKQLNSRTVIFIVDDNITGRPGYAKKLFKALIPLKIRWFGQSSIIIANNKELLKLAAQSGCMALFVGFETLSSSNLEQMGKTTNRVQDYSTAIKKIHDSGIGIVGAFIFGFDSDDDSVFEKTVRFIDRNKLELSSFSILTPLPGTRLHKQMHEQERIIERDWAKYTCGEVVFRPKLLEVDQLQGGYYWARKQISSYSSIFRRTFLPRKSALISLPINLVMRKASRAFLKEQKNGGRPVDTTMRRVGINVKRAIGSREWATQSTVNSP
jgi:radical SAM superfamily enzyme YgiQ (UPF0313 family)